MKYIINRMRSLSILQFSVILAFYFSVVLNAPLINELYQKSHGSIQFLVSAPLILMSLFVIIFYVVAIPYFRKFFFIILTFTSAIACYAIYKYRIFFDYNMVANFMQTNLEEANSYLYFHSVIDIIFLGIIPCVLIAGVKFKPTSYKRYFLSLIGSVFVAILVIGSCYRLFYKDYASVIRNHKYIAKMIVPAHFVQGVRYVYKTYIKTPLPYQHIGMDAKLMQKQGEKPTLFIFMLGETARAHNYSYNGYKRDTTPFTDPLNLIRVPNMATCGTATAVSVPCMFSRLDRHHYTKEKFLSQDNVLDIIHRAGVKVIWWDNDGGDKNVVDRIGKREFKSSESKTYCDGTTCQDGIFVETLDKKMKAMEQNKHPQDTLMVMHLIGSHGPTYYQRYPKKFAHFTPTCMRSDIENCTDQEITNAYDNSLYYTDFVMKSLIEKLKKLQNKYQVGLMYMSDHGESLGENGTYLHGTPYSFAPEEQIHVPWMIWMGKDFMLSRQINETQIKKDLSIKTHSQDQIFDTLLKLMQVDTKVFNAKLSLF